MCGRCKKDKSKCLYCPLVACDCMLPPWMRAKVRQSYCTYRWGQNPVVQLPCPGSADYGTWWCKQMRRQTDICTSTDNRHRTASTSCEQTNQSMAPRHQSQVCWCANSQSVGTIPSFAYQPSQDPTSPNVNPINNSLHNFTCPPQEFDSTIYKSLPNIPGKPINQLSPEDQFCPADQNQMTCVHEVEVRNWTMEKNQNNMENHTISPPQNLQAPARNTVNPYFQAPVRFAGNIPNNTGNIDFNDGSTQKKGKWSFRDFISKKTHAVPAPPLGCKGCYPPSIEQACVDVNQGSCNCGKK